MANELRNKRVAALVDNGFEQSELLRPKRALEEAGATAYVVSPKSGAIRGWKEADWGDEVEELSPLEVTLNLDGREDSVLPVRLETRVTELGTLEVWCVTRDGAHRWKLEFNIRGNDEE